MDRWEGLKPKWTETYPVLQHFREEINKVTGSSDDGRETRIMLICGSDLLDSFNTPDLWAVQHMTGILQEHGICVIERDTAATANVIFGNDLLYENRNNIMSIPQHVQNDISSTKVRLCLKRGLSVKYMTPDPVIDYMKKHKLYQNKSS